MIPASAFRRVLPPPIRLPLLRRRHTGQSLVEWTLLLALIAITCAATLGQLGQGISATLLDVNASLMGNMGGSPMSGGGSPSPP